MQTEQNYNYQRLSRKPLRPRRKPGAGMMDPVTGGTRAPSGLKPKPRRFSGDPKVLPKTGVNRLNSNKAIDLKKVRRYNRASY